MKKIEIVDCCNRYHKISMMISDSRMDFSDDVYMSLENQKGLSDKQIKKLNNFRKSCLGPIMVDGLYFSDNDSEYLGSKNFAWTCYYFYKANGFVFKYIKAKQTAGKRRADGGQTSVNRRTYGKSYQGAPLGADGCGAAADARAKGGGRLRPSPWRSAAAAATRAGGGLNNQPL